MNTYLVTYYVHANGAPVVATQTVFAAGVEGAKRVMWDGFQVHTYNIISVEHSGHCGHDACAQRKHCVYL